MTVRVCGVRRTAALAVIVACFAVGRLDAECVGVKNSREGKKYASHIFSGRVTEVSDHTVRFDVNRVWRGAVRQQFLMFVMPGEDLHSAEFFKKGTSYLVFANAFSRFEPSEATPSVPAGTPIVWVSMCNATLPAEAAQAWIKQLGAGKSPMQ